MTDCTKKFPPLDGILSTKSLKQNRINKSHQINFKHFSGFAFKSQTAFASKSVNLLNIRASTLNSFQLKLNSFLKMYFEEEENTRFS